MYVNVCGSLSYIRHENGVMYPACAGKFGDRQCSKKMRDEGQQGHEGQTLWHCERCNVDSPNVDWRYMLSITAADSTGHSWLTAFNEAVRASRASTRATVPGETMQQANQTLQSTF